MENNPIHYQALIIGFGKAGKTLAAFLATQGWQVALAEQSAQMYGGTCINIACIPTKSLVHSSELGVPYAEAIAEKNRLTAYLRQRNLATVTSAPVTVYTGQASFVTPKQVLIRLTATGEEVLVEAGHIFLNTGTQPRLPDLPGLRGNPRVFTSTGLLEQSILPKRLVIIGGGFIGLEFASMYAQFGAAVTVLEAGPTFLPREDEDVADTVRSILARKAIRIETSVHLLRVEPSDTAEDIVVYQDEHGHTQRVGASAILVAAGREPVTAGLNLPAAGVTQDERGYIPVNEHLQTNVPHIWALGDVNGGAQFTYISLDDYRIVRDQLFGSRTRATTDRQFVASTVFISPPLAHVGLRETEARAQGYQVRVATLPAAASVRAQILQQTQGLLKAVVEVGTDRILGCTLLCAEAGEIINVVQLAMQAGLPYTVLRDHIYTHPSVAEVLNDLFAKIPEPLSQPHRSAAETRVGSA
jgi:pyruvate/2-oxoglutarate dehydrogenase complex dihydrolipoamide dehydrogenase (E3) component